uniref:membrane-spanning 4-domains subfamily A member 15-like n=1 Tax=Pristiophorus japonicus TaxID=55135 RepID=UPI00398E909A
MSSAATPKPAGGLTAAPTATIQLHQQGKPLQKFLNGEPKALGVTLIMLGIIQFGFGVPLRMAKVSEITGLGTPWWLAVLFIVSGALTIVCGQDPNKPRVTACLATNIINVIATGIAVFIFCVDLSSWHYIHNTEVAAVMKYRQLSYGIKTVLFFFAVSGAVLNIILSVFCCKGLRYCSPSTQMF